MELEKVSSCRSFEGWHSQYRHFSNTLNCSMRFAIYLPPNTSNDAKNTNNTKVPVVYWLSGLTCTDENFMQKAGAHRVAAELGIAIVAPDTSPRGDDVPDDPDACYDFGLGAGFYVNATQPPWNRHYRMYDYVLQELPSLIEEHFPVSEQRAISGHSMGGHGALIMALRNPTRFSSVSAFSPICHPMECPWGKKAFANYLGDNREEWKAYDAVELMRVQPLAMPALIDQGSADEFLEVQLQPDALIAEGNKCETAFEFRMQQGYDHSYYFIATFIEDHLRFHVRNFKPQ